MENRSDKIKINDDLEPSCLHKQELYNDKHLTKLVLELIVYLIFLTIITTLSLSFSGESYYYLTKVVIDTFVEEKFPLNDLNDEGSAFSAITTTFKDLVSVEEFWKWFEMILLPSFTYNSGFLYLTPENRLLGPPRIMQVRVTNNTCSVPQLFKNHFEACYAQFEINNEDKLAFGHKNSSAWHYQTIDDHLIDDGADYVRGYFGLYPTGSFAEVLSLTEETNKAIFGSLYSGNWIDRKTRAIIIEFSFYNANLDMLCFVQFLVEKMTTGMLVTSTNVQCVHLFNSDNATDLAMFVLEVMLVPLIIYYTLEELLEMYRLRLKYFTKLWNLIDLSISIIVYVGMAFIIQRETFIGEKLERHVNAPHEFVNFEIFVQRQKQFKNLVGVCLFLAWIKSLKYLSFNKTMMQFSTTLSRCSRDLLGFGLMFLIVFVAYAQLGYIAFGNDLEDFHTFSSAIFTLFRTILGEFDYLEIERANHILGPIYFMSYIFFVFFVLLNMFLAIINDTYSEIKNEIQQDSVPVGDFVSKKFKYYWNKITSCFTWINRKETVEQINDHTNHVSQNSVKFNNNNESDVLSQFSYTELHKMEHRIVILESELQKMVGRIDTFIKNVTHSLNGTENEEETTDNERR